eukprot:CAMPEP_0206290954 /NCGR_PEP_ID=MMETSP0106_2-20121207/2880_1 /ASSEMBLY_ACC=CAM_ASM_000206 /TAXON_ID=81532 /ORGANISM="Acanthoeca-like sp., Strain 10tr" /LENGTH=245 /DNA_ID=CAMNT_0053721519 /DNA_START=164 /DNA_END=901 /DNA_ORIENTATION=+
MVRRKLQALGYPHADNFDPMNDGQLRNLVVWLEDTKICKYKIEERTALRQVDGPKWVVDEKYLADLQCPRDTGIELREVRCEMLDWLVGHAVALQVSDDPTAYPAVKPAAGGADAGAAAAAAPAPLDLSRAELVELAALLQLPEHEDDKVLLRAIASVLITKFKPSAVAAALAAKDEPQREISLDNTPLGFATGDSALDKASKVLRLLHIADLRDLQTRINELIVSVQMLTANPKTNSRLGKVGK